MGRLRRNKQTGLFPSNFVRVLDPGFQPVSRGTSPMTGSPSSSLSTPKASPQKTKTFRKPFQAYARAGSPNPAASLSHGGAAGSPATSPNPSRQSSLLEQSSRSPSRQPSYLNKSSNSSRQPSYLQTPSGPLRQLSYEESSSSPTRRGSYLSRLSRPSSPHQHASDGFHVPSTSSILHDDAHEELEDAGSSPPPPPPPHRVAYNASPSRTTSSPTPLMDDRHPVVSTGLSPAPCSPHPTGQTPSPLRDAMDDVMSSLHDMQMGKHENPSSPEEDQPPLNPWSPEAFEALRTNPHTRIKRRPRSSLGIASSQMDHGQDDMKDQDSALGGSYDAPPQADEYAQQMKSRLRSMGATSPRPPDELFLPDDGTQPPPAVPPKNSPHPPRPQSSMDACGFGNASVTTSRKLRARKSAYELGRTMLDRTISNKTNATSSSSGVQSVSTNGTTSTQRTSQSIMSGYSAGGFSATSAGSLARRTWGSISRGRRQSVIEARHDAMLGFNNRESTTRPRTPSQHSADSFKPGSSVAQNRTESAYETGGLLGGLTTPKTKKSGFFRKLVESAKAGAASTRSTIADGRVEQQRSPIKGLLPNGGTAIAGGSAARDRSVGGSKSDNDWVQVRRDVNRSNTLSRNERMERAERCQMMDYPVIASVDALYENIEGDESADGLPVQQPTDYQSVNLQLVDKSARFVNSLPPMTNATSLAQGYVCRPYRSDVQRLRAIFTWVSEKVSWEEDFEGDIDTRRVIQMRRGCAEETAVLVSEMCAAVGLHAETVRGYLKSPGESVDNSFDRRPNHWWNTVIVDDCWRIMDCSLASPTNPKRGLYSSAGSHAAENGFFLARPSEICYTHIPSNFEQQHVVPPLSPEILLALPCACPTYFKNGLQMVNYDTSLFRIENLELVHIQFLAPSDVECVAEVEARSYAHDGDGDVFESGDTLTTRALAQAEWVGGQKRYTVKAHLAGDECHGTLKVYAGKRGLMHSVRDNPHPLAFAIPIEHTGPNPPYEFFLRHPTPHAQRHDLYVAQPQCHRLALNNTFVFAVRQHPSSLGCFSPSEPRSNSPLPFTRPSSAMSMVSSATSDYFSQTSSNSNDMANQQSKQEKPAKLAVQAPSGKIIRLMRKSDNCVSSAEAADGGVWETIIKVGERGTWRGLVLADRSARWCVFGEWNCV